jgi:hypothetical protein
MKRIFSLKAVAAAGAMTVALLGAGVAYATWAATGTGNGAATATTSKAITGTAASSGTNDDFYPGAAAVAVNGTLNNPNHFPVKFTGWSGLAITGISGAGAGGCADTDFTVTDTGSAVNTAAAQAPSAPVSLPGAIKMNSGAGDGCQGVVVSVSFTLTGGTQN